VGEDRDVSDEAKSPLEQAIELLVYAPLGLALTARDELPRLIDKGRQRVTGQVAMAKMMGQFAVAQGQKEAEKVVKQATETLSGVTGSRPSAAAPPSSSSARPSGAPSATASTTSSSAASPSTSPSTSPSATPRATGNGSTPSPAPAATPTASDDDLAIPGYGALAASQVVQRLAGLSGAELEAVRVYEVATRGRKTILHRIEQLQAPAAG
jgi:hypothetical protein